MPSDEELLDRLDVTPWTELSDDEIAALVTRAGSSSAVRKALLERIALEHALHAQLDPPSVTSSELLQALRPPRSAARLLAGAGLAVVLLLTGLVWWFPSNPTTDPDAVPREPSHSPPTRTLTGDAPPTSPLPRSPVEADRPPSGMLDSTIVSPSPNRTESQPGWQQAIVTAIAGTMNLARDALRPIPAHGRFVAREIAPLAGSQEGFGASRLSDAFNNLLTQHAPELIRRFENHPLATEPNREGVTLALELEAALRNGANTDAARLIPAIAAVEGLVPALGESALMVPSERLVTDAVSRHPGLATALQQAFGPSALQKVRQAIDAGNPRAVARLSIAYHGTRAAGEAHRWLGERALASGDLATARQELQHARFSLPQSARADVEARLQLVCALAGSLDSKTKSGPTVSIGARTIAPPEWDEMISELNEHHRHDNHSATSASLRRPGPRRARETLHITEHLGRDVDPRAHRDHDWAGRQFAAMFAREMLYISNRFQVVAYEDSRDAVAWTNALGAEQGNAHAWPGVPFRPLIRGNRLIVRRLLGRGPELVALSLADEGKTLWRSDDELTVVADPWIQGDELLAVTTPRVRRGGRPLVLSLTRFRLDDGRAGESVPLFVLDSAAIDEPCVFVTPHDNGFSLLAPGVAGRFDGQGDVRWLRKLPVLPAGIDLRPHQVAPTSPLRVGETIYVANGDLRQVTSLDATRGRRLWSRPLPRLSRLITADENTVIVRAGEKIVGLDASSGVPTWQRRLPGLFDAVLFDSGLLLVPRLATDNGDQNAMTLTWIRIADGETIDSAPVALPGAPPQLAGPFVRLSESVGLFVGDHRADGSRTLLELEVRRVKSEE